MSRGGTVRDALGNPDATVVGITPSGDCFYQSIAIAFKTVDLDVRQYDNVVSEASDQPEMALRR